MNDTRRGEARGHVVALCGGIGGAKLALGLSHAVPGEQLVIAVNTGDDFEHLGLHISPDIDTVVYTLAGIVNTESGWGRAEESWCFMEALAMLGGEAWFRLGDKDLATHVERTRRLRAGESLSTVTAGIRKRLGVKACVLPMSDDPVRTTVETGEGVLPFQHYFVRRRCEPEVRAVFYAGADAARLQPDIAHALASPHLWAVILCPSNPYLSLGPMLAIPGMREALTRSAAPVIAVTPLVGGQAVKGPMAKIMNELGIDRTPASIAGFYDGLIDGFILDRADAASASDMDLPIVIEQTVMVTLEDRIALANACLSFADRLAGDGSRKERVA
ncbi:MAG: 2-phospho-L-lactate transferase [Pseudomonadota bacterium]|nr:2-phospho-L-lactate transferase [Pseudomonadota bacterium]